MSCLHHYYLPGDGSDGRDSAFSIDASRIVFGRGALDEVGDHARALGCRRVALFTDRTVGGLPHAARAKASLGAAGVDAAIFDGVRVEPTDASFIAAARFAAEGRFDGYVSVGGGSVIDTAKAAALYATYPADFLTYVNTPVGAGAPVPGPLPPHLACPTTCGTGSETTGIAVCDVIALGAKTGIASPRLRPTLAIVDPSCTHTLPGQIVAASGFDVLCHAIESYTARPYCERAKPVRPSLRPMSQGANPWSDAGSLHALRLGGANLLRAVSDASDHAARERLAWAATLAGVAFGNAGVHLPHGMAYAIAGRVRDFHMPGYPTDEPMVPHGVSVVVGAPSAFRFTASACPERHLECAALIGADVRGAAPEDAGPILGDALIALMRRAHVPVDLAALGYGDADVPGLVEGTLAQQRLLTNAPRAAGPGDLDAVFRDAMHTA